MPEYNPLCAQQSAQSHSLVFTVKHSHLQNVDSIFSELASSPCIGTQHPQYDVPYQPQQTKQQQQTQTQTQKKPRSTWAFLKRNFSTLANHTKQPFQQQNQQQQQTTKRITFTTQTEFRTYFLRNNRQRILRDPKAGLCFRLLPIVMNGDCGFAAIAKGINIARQFLHTKEKQDLKQSNPSTSTSSSGTPPRKYSSIHDLMNRLWKKTLSNTDHHDRKRVIQAVDIRNAMRLETRQAKKTYLADSQTYAGVFTNNDFDKLEKDVSRPGISGHWLGTVLGVLEHVIVAHAMNINIYLYQFDLQKQCIRQFESATVDHPDYHVYLFFTGPAACGHFDTMVQINDPKENVLHS